MFLTYEGVNVVLSYMKPVQKVRYNGFCVDIHFVDEKSNKEFQT